MDDLYNTLGLDRSASSTDIRKAYRRKAKEHHPDQGGDPQAFHALTRAHDVLGDDAKRERYDRTGKVDDSPAQNEDAAALAMLAALIESIGEDENAVHEDIIGTMRNALKDAGKQVDVQLGDAKKTVKRFEKLAKQLKRKANASGVVAAMFANNVAKAQARVDAGVAHRRNIDRAVELLEGYSFEPEKAPQPKFDGNSWVNDDLYAKYFTHQQTSKSRTFFR